jgi:hypothetical protein
MGPWMHQLLATLCVALSLTMFTRGDVDPVSGFCLLILSYGRPTTIMGPVLDIVAVSHDVAGALHEESRWHVNMYLMHAFIAPVGACRFASLVVIAQYYKAGSLPCANLDPLEQTPVSSSPPPLHLKRERGREIDLETRERVVELIGCYFSFPYKPWQSRVGSH